MDEVVIALFCSDAFTCTLDDKLTCISKNSGGVCDQLIIPPASSAEDNVNFVDDDDVPSLDEPGSYLTATTFLSISSECNELENTISGFGSAKKLKLLEKCVASSINIKGLVFCTEHRFHLRLPSVAEPSQSGRKD